MINSKNSGKNLIILTVYFPPTISIASNRLLAFAKYLDSDKFNITVICPEVEKVESSELIINKVRIIRIKNKKHPLKIRFNKKDSYVIHKLKAVYNLVFNQFIRDEYRYWSKSAIKYITNEFDKIGIDYLISSFPTVAPHLVALNLKKSEFSFKWIADMRDGMSQNPFSLFFQRRYLKSIESKIFENVWKITTVTPGLVRSFKLSSQIYSCPIIEIRNGFDFEIPIDYHYNEIFTICHAGTFHADIKPFRFFAAIRELLNEKKLLDIKINFIGAGNAIKVPEDLISFVYTTSKIPHDQAIEYMKNSDANLLIIPHSISETLPGKLYEYIASQKPIIIISARNSEAENIVTMSNAGFVADENNMAEIKKAIMDAHGLWATKGCLHVNNEYFSQFHRKNQVKKLEKIMLIED
jgi:glycosyltransferase involved in cell wall biosynthesis